MTTLNICLGVVGMTLWIIPAVWYFKNDVRSLWVRRHDKWFRN